MHYKGLIPKAVTTKEFFTYVRLGNLEDQNNKNRINCYGTKCNIP